MRIFKNPIFITCCLIFWINQAVEYWSFESFLFLYSYLDDLLAMPVILGLTLQIFQWIHPKKDNFRFTKTQVIVGFLYVSVAFEWFLPAYSDTYTRDFWDIFCYFLGTIVFYLGINPKNKTISN